jgi:hypothetical protein
VYGGDVTVDEELHVIAGGPPPAPKTVLADLRRHNAVPAGASNVVVRRDLLDAVGRFDPQLRTSEDWDVWMRLAAKSEPACVPKPLVALRTHGRMASRRIQQVFADIDTVSRDTGSRSIGHATNDGPHGCAWRTAREAAPCVTMPAPSSPATSHRSDARRLRPSILALPIVERFIRDDWANGAQQWLDELRRTPLADDRHAYEREQWR